MGAAIAPVPSSAPASDKELLELVAGLLEAAAAVARDGQAAAALQGVRQAVDLLALVAAPGARGRV